MKEFGVQLYSVRNTMNDAESIRDTFRKLREMGYTQAQTAGCEIPFADFGRIAEEEGLQIVGTHEPFDPMVENFEEALANHQALNTKFMGIGLYTRSQEPEVWYDFCKKAKHGLNVLLLPFLCRTSSGVSGKELKGVGTNPLRCLCHI